jgi:tyrosinase
MAVLTALAPNRTSFIASKTLSGTITIRKSANAMSAVEIQNYRLAVYRTAAISAQNQADNRGYQWVAGIHGDPQGRCKHGLPAFALWHRPYIQLYEQILQDAVAETFVPFWDWTVDRQIPQIFLDATWNNPDTGQQEPNPLLTQPMNGGAPTSRQPGAPADLIPDADLVAQALLATDHDAFSPDLENAHNDVHMWVGGDMGSINSAAYDPLFWSHHSFVEYMFCKWQDAHTAAPQPIDVTADDLIPFGVTVDQIWNYRALGYVYESATAKPLTLSAPAAASSEGVSQGLESGAIVTALSLHQVDPEFNRAEVRFEGLTPPEKTFELRVFVNEPKANAGTPTYENPHYLGSQHFFGHGGCFGAPGHCEPLDRDIFDLRPPHHYAPVNVRLNVSKRLRPLLRQKNLRDVPITLVAVDAKGGEIPYPGLTFEGLVIVIR